MNKPDKLKIGDKIIVLSGIKPLDTVIENITQESKESDEQPTKLYWFRDENNVLWHETSFAIVKRNSN